MKEIVEIEDLQNLIDNQNETPIILKFHSEWCGPCKALTPTLDAIESEMKNIKFFSVNIENVPEIASKYNIRSIPTLIFIENGEVKDRLIGLVSKDVILKKINEFVNL